ncbi:hypothetical protein O9993_02425 [Vibrio lentus]|nr:hypothetical protein [Vibrio lentus]
MTIGDGLVAQIPCPITFYCCAMMVTRQKTPMVWASNLSSRCSTTLKP